jgi:pilus assembly protein CpaF
MSLRQRIEGLTGTQMPPAGGSVMPTETPSRLEEAAFRRPVLPSVRDGFQDLKTRVQDRLIAELDPTMDLTRTDLVRRTVEEMFNVVLEQEGVTISRVDRAKLFEQIVAEILGFGPIEPLLKDDAITEVMVNGPKKVYYEKDGLIFKSDVVFDHDDHVKRIIDRIISPLGRRCDESSPMVDARLPDGSRVNAVIPPVSLVGPVITIRKFSKRFLQAEDYIRLGTLVPEVVEFLRACVLARLNIIVSGGTGSGKTTFLNMLSAWIPSEERIVTIEDAAELQLRQDHVIIMETRKPNVEGKGEITIRDLVINSLRMRPDRIVVGECRGKEALDMLQAMNTGHDGSMTTAHSNSPRDVLSRLETMVLMAGYELPVKAIREQVSRAVDLIVHLDRMKDGTRKVTSVCEVQGMEGDIITMQDIFMFEQKGMEGGKIVGRLKPTGIRPKFMEKLESRNIFLSAAIFGIPERMFR